MGDIYSLDTPESVSVGYEVAGVGTRFLAALVDTVLQIGIMVALLIVTVAVGGAVNGTGGFVAVAIGLLIINVILLGYYIFFELVWNGQSPGKRALRLRVILTSGYPITPFAVLIRNVLRLVDWLPGLYAVGVITMIANRHARRLGDLAAGTMVIKEGREGRLSSLPSTQAALPSAPTPLPLGPSAAMTGPYGSPVAAPWNGPAPAYLPPATPYYSAPPDAQALIAAGAQIERLTREDEVLIRDFLRRRSTLPPQRRDELARRIAAVIYDRLGGAPVAYHGAVLAPEPYLELVLAVREAR